MNEQDIVNKLKSDPRALKSVMQSQDGQALLNMLSGGNSAALGQAARQAASGLAEARIHDQRASRTRSPACPPWSR